MIADTVRIWVGRHETQLPYRFQTKNHELDRVDVVGQQLVVLNRDRRFERFIPTAFKRWLGDVRGADYLLTGLWPIINDRFFQD